MLTSDNTVLPNKTSVFVTCSVQKLKNILFRCNRKYCYFFLKLWNQRTVINHPGEGIRIAWMFKRSSSNFHDLSQEYKCYVFGGFKYPKNHLNEIIKDNIFFIGKIFSHFLSSEKGERVQRKCIFCILVKVVKRWLTPLILIVQSLLEKSCWRTKWTQQVLKFVVKQNFQVWKGKLTNH